MNRVFDITKDGSITETTRPLLELSILNADGLDPSLIVEPSHVSPTGLNVFIGFYQKYFIEYFIAPAVTFDFKRDQLPINLKQQKKHLKALAQEAKDYRRQMGAAGYAMEKLLQL